MAAMPNKTNTPKKTKNPLISGADLGFPYENICGSAILMPIAHEESVIPKEDVGATPKPQPQESPPPPQPPTPSSNPLFSLFKEVLPVNKFFDPFSLVSNTSQKRTESPQNIPDSSVSPSENNNHQSLPLFPPLNTSQNENNNPQMSSVPLYPPQSNPNSYLTPNKSISPQLNPIPLYPPQENQGANINPTPPPVPLFSPENTPGSLSSSNMNNNPPSNPLRLSRSKNNPYRTSNSQAIPASIYPGQSPPVSFFNPNERNIQGSPIPSYLPPSNNQVIAPVTNEHQSSPVPSIPAHVTPVPFYNPNVNNIHGSPIPFQPLQVTPVTTSEITPPQVTPISFFNPNQNTQGGSPVIFQSPQTTPISTRNDINPETTPPQVTPISFFNPNQNTQGGSPVIFQPPQTTPISTSNDTNHESIAPQVTPISFYNPNHYDQGSTIPSQPQQVTLIDESEGKSSEVTPVTFYNPNISNVQSSYTPFQPPQPITSSEGGTTPAQITPISFFNPNQNIQGSVEPLPPPVASDGFNPEASSAQNINPSYFNEYTPEVAQINPDQETTEQKSPVSLYDRSSEVETTSIFTPSSTEVATTENVDLSTPLSLPAQDIEPTSTLEKQGEEKVHEVPSTLSLPPSASPKPMSPIPSDTCNQSTEVSPEKDFQSNSVNQDQIQKPEDNLNTPTTEVLGASTPTPVPTNIFTTPQEIPCTLFKSETPLENKSAASFFNSVPENSVSQPSTASFFNDISQNTSSEQATPFVTPNIFNPNQTIPVSIFSPLPAPSNEGKSEAAPSPNSTKNEPSLTNYFNQPQSKTPTMLTSSMPQPSAPPLPSNVETNPYNPSDPRSYFSSTQTSTYYEPNPYYDPSMFEDTQNSQDSFLNSLPLTSTQDSTPVQSVPFFSYQPNVSTMYNQSQSSNYFATQDSTTMQTSTTSNMYPNMNYPMQNNQVLNFGGNNEQEYPLNPVNLFNSTQNTPISLYSSVSGNTEQTVSPVQPIPLYPTQNMFENSINSNQPQSNYPVSTQGNANDKVQNLFNSNVSLYGNTTTIQNSEIPSTESTFVPYFTPISEPSNSRPQSQTSFHSKTSRPPSVNSNQAPNIIENKNSRPNSVNSIISNISNSVAPNIGTITESSNQNAASFFDNPKSEPRSETSNPQIEPQQSKTPVSLFNPNMFRQPQKLKTPKYVNPNCYESVKTNVNPHDSFIPTIPNSSVKVFDPTAFNPTPSETPPIQTPQNNPNTPANFFDQTPPKSNLPPPPLNTFNPNQQYPQSKSPASYFTPKPQETIPTPPILEEATFINQNSSSIFGPIIDTPSLTQTTSQIPLFNPNNPPQVPLFNEVKNEHRTLNQFQKPVPLFSTSGETPEKSTSPQPASIPVTVSQINPKQSHILNPYSKSTVSSGIYGGISNNQVTPAIFTPPSIPVSTDHHYASQPPASGVSEQLTSENPPPPPKSAMSGGNSFRLGGNSRPQYAPPPGLGQSVSAIASLAASMAMSTPMPVPGSHYDPQPIVPSITASAPGVSSAAELFNSASIPSDLNTATYRPVYQHWFYMRTIENRAVWMPFSMNDSLELEKAFTSGEADPIIATDGGRYDVHVMSRRREPVYWSQPANEVRRCSWFYRGALDSRSTPYEETFAERLEEEYRNAFQANYWPHRVEMSYGEAIIMNGPLNMVHIPPTAGSILEDWGTIQEQGTKPRTVRRGCDEFDIDEGEPGKPDHLLFLVHGIGSACDLKFRSVVEVVDDFRSMALTLVRSHFRSGADEGRVNRVEVLPVSWHSALHGEETGIDKQLQGITLKSIPKLRHFTNDTLLDILFYTSPVYCQTIIRQVGHELNRLQQVFQRRNPDFSGGISLGGHSLGSLILFDLLCHQKPPPGIKTPSTDPLMFDEEVEDELGDDEPVPPPRHLRRRESCRVDYMVGPAGTGQPFISYPQLHFNPMAFFALGSPIAMFVTVRGIESLGQDFCLPTCPAFFNVFHPFDPVAYRIEALINPELSKLRPVVIPHHKGRKRMHIELRETMARVGTDLKERLVDSVKSTWNSVYQLAMFNRGESLEQEVDKVLAQQMMATESLQEEPILEDTSDPDPQILGRLNSGRRVDHVLQEAPLESFNEYLFALGSHVCYWESEDTMLMMLKEIYTMLGVTQDRQFDRSRENSVMREMPRERSWSGGSKGSASPSQYFINQNRPTPPSTPPNLTPLAPPPMSGFVRK